MSFKKCSALFLALVMMACLTVTCFAAGNTMEVPAATSGISPYADDFGPTIDIDSVVRPANANTIKVYLTVPENQPNGVYFRASVVGDAGTKYNVFVDYPDGRTHAPIGQCSPNGNQLNAVDTNYISAGTYVFRFVAKEQANSNEVGFIAAIYQRL